MDWSGPVDVVLLFAVTVTTTKRLPVSRSADTVTDSESHGAGSVTVTGPFPNSGEGTGTSQIYYQDRPQNGEYSRWGHGTSQTEAKKLRISAAADGRTAGRGAAWVRLGPSRPDQNQHYRVTIWHDYPAHPVSSDDI